MEIIIKLVHDKYVKFDGIVTINRYYTAYDTVENSQ